MSDQQDNHNPHKVVTLKLSPLSQRLSALLLQCWNWPASWDWMNPLPLRHRRMITALALLSSLLFLLPEKSPDTITESEPIMLNAYLVNQAENSAEDRSWKSYPAYTGQTLTELFRNHQLSANDAIELLKVEGENRPLSRLQSGQVLKLKFDPQQTIIAVNMELADKQQAFYIRQPDGSFYRYQ